MSKAVIIDDEIQIRRLLRMVLEARGYEVSEAAEGTTGLQEIAFRRPDVVLLDLGLPGLGGLEVLKRLREWSEVPVLILSVRDQEAVKVEALESGADDYVTKPFGTAELLVRLTVIQRRRFTRQSPHVTAGPLTLDLLHHEATLHGEQLKLTPLSLPCSKSSLNTLVASSPKNRSSTTYGRPKRPMPVRDFGSTSATSAANWAPLAHDSSTNQASVTGWSTSNRCATRAGRELAMR